MIRALLARLLVAALVLGLAATYVWAAEIDAWMLSVLGV